MPDGVDIFVGLVAITLGATIIAGGLMRWGWYSELPKFGWLETSLGPAAARIVNTGIGTAIIGLGVWILW